MCDNARTHKTDRIKSVFEGQKIQHHLEFLPEYSPHLNPIENIFGIWKGEIYKNRNDNIDSAFKAIDEAAKKITSEM